MKLFRMKLFLLAAAALLILSSFKAVSPPTDSNGSNDGYLGLVSADNIFIRNGRSKQSLASSDVFVQDQLSLEFPGTALTPPQPSHARNHGVAMPMPRHL